MLNLDSIAKNPIANSSRRLLNVFSDGGTTGRYDPSQIGTHASGTLLWFNCKYFLLTARHCIQKFRDENGDEIPLSDLQNPSPFWVNKSDNFREGDHNLDFLYIRKIWFIGEMFKNLNLDGVDLEDICLLEIYYPMQLVKNYINLDEPEKTVSDKNDIKNSPMGFSGYPAEKNPYFYEQNEIAPISANATHSTLFSRWHDCGLNVSDTNMIKLMKNRTFDYSGMCGGVVFSISTKDSSCKWAGMYISGSEDTVRYVPSYLILNSILNYRKSRFLVVDTDAEICGGSNYVSNEKYREAVTHFESLFKKKEVK